MSIFIITTTLKKICNIVSVSNSSHSISEGLWIRFNFKVISEFVFYNHIHDIVHNSEYITYCIFQLNRIYRAHEFIFIGLWIWITMTRSHNIHACGQPQNPHLARSCILNLIKMTLRRSLFQQYINIYYELHIIFLFI